MEYLKINIYTKSEAINILICGLEELGVAGFEIHDYEDFKEFLNDKSANWDYIDDNLMKTADVSPYVTLYLPHDNQGVKMHTEIIAYLNSLIEKDKELFGNLKLESDFVKEEDWENCWKQYYKPFQVGNKIIIKPTWEEIDVPDNMLVLEIDPASAFGTGQHATTQLCIEALEKHIFPEAKVLDLGCGSGILSIASLLLGAENVTMVDIMENAVKTAKENVFLNNFGEKTITAYCGDVIKDISLRNKLGKFDIITANIVADIIIPISGFIKEFTREGSTIVFSGIISERLDDVKNVLIKNGLKILSIDEKEGWNAVICH